MQNSPNTSARSKGQERLPRNVFRDKALDLFDEFFFEQSATLCSEDLWQIHIAALASAYSDTLTPEQRSDQAYTIKKISDFLNQAEALYQNYAHAAHHQ